jgi:hypothetical protein
MRAQNTFLTIHPVHTCRAAIFIIYNFPVIKKATVDGLETIFQTKAIARQLALAIALETGMVGPELA